MFKVDMAAPQADADRESKTQMNRLKESCQNFEAIMMNNLLKEMRRNPLGTEQKDQGQEIYQGMMDEAVTSMLSQKGDIGLGETLYRQLAPLMGEHER